jgi:hypothetical protein
VKRHRLLFGLVTVLGIVFLSLFLVVTRASAISEAVSTFLSLQLWNFVVPFCLLGGIIFLTVGLIGLGRQRLWNQTIMKHSRLLFAFIVLLGVFLVAAFFAIVYWGNTFSAEILTMQSLIPSPYLSYFMLFSIIVGTFFLTIGILGIGRHYFKNHSRLFFLVAMLVPMIVLTSFVSMMSVFWDPLYEAPERLVITHVSVNSTYPLILSLNVKSLYSVEIDFVEACVKNDKQVTVASIEGTWVTVEIDEWGPVSRMQFVGQLPGGSEKTLTFNFNTTSPSGNYSVWLYSRRYYTFVSPHFAIP